MAVFAVTVAEILEGVLYVILGRLTDASTVAISEQFSDVSLSGIWFWLALFAGIFFVTECIWRLSGFWGMRLITESEANVSKSLFAYLLNHSRAYFNSKFAGSLVNKIGHASSGVDHMMSRFLWNYYPLFISLIVNTVILSLISYQLGLILIGWTLLFLVLNYYFVKQKQHLSYANANANSEMKGKMVDTIGNIASVHANAYHRHEYKYVKQFIKKRREIHLASWMASEWILFINGGLLAIFVFLMLFVTVFLMKGNAASMGSLVLVITMTIGLVRSLFFIGSNMTDTIDDYSQIEEGLNELIVPYEITDRPGSKNIRSAKGAIEFANVYFSFGNTKVFNNFSLSIKPGQKVGIVGVSGAGKTTFVNLLMRNHDVEKGSIRVDGNDVRDITRESLRRQIAFVPQDVSLFHRSIIENIRYGRLSATEKEVIESAKKAQAHVFIKGFEESYKTFVGERGVKLSGGQRQRVAIARAFLKGSPILVLDEATSALDSESEVMVQSALARLMQGKTVIAIAHRLSTLRVMDRIVVMEKGKIVEDGNHESLVEKGGVYAGLWDHQVEGFIE
ncbi:ABC transporter ATP-binding protein/permease [Patescibacteria group bacterium]|nr:ABC transporter ATP-binding protein/permease [Patescibacteria group bacterium]